MLDKRDLLTVAAGALLALSVLIFIDGAVMAKRCGESYSFFMYLPQILCYCGGILLQLVNPESLTRDTTSFDDDSEEIRSKATFFVSAVAFFAALALAIWKLINPYSSSSAVWPGVAIVMEVVLLAISFVVLFARKGTDDNDDF